MRQFAYQTLKVYGRAIGVLKARRCAIDRYVPLCPNGVASGTSFGLPSRAQRL